MRNRHRETEFLRQCILYDDTGERDKIEEGITRVQRDERCVRRAALLMVVLTGLSMAGLCYSAIFLSAHPQSMSQFATQFLCKAFCALGLGSLICLASFLGMGVAYRRELDQHREECRRLAVKVLESRLGKPAIPPWPRVLKEQERVE